MKRCMFNSRDVTGESFPIHFAANRKFNSRGSKSKMIVIIEAVLSGDANPFYHSMKVVIPSFTIYSKMTGS